nr:MAG TPA: hypothetical protein [Caudoviricetes sp.]
MSSLRSLTQSFPCWRLINIGDMDKRTKEKQGVRRGLIMHFLLLLLINTILNGS